MQRAELGNFGDFRYIRDGVWELRIDLGPGWRIYYAIAEKTVLLLLCAGNKKTQSSDIEKACAYWQEWQIRQLQWKNDHE